MMDKDEYGVAGNGRKGRWYVEVDEDLETAQQFLLITDPDSGEEIEVGTVENPNDLNDLIDAIRQARDDLLPKPEKHNKPVGSFITKKT